MCPLGPENPILSDKSIMLFGMSLIHWNEHISYLIFFKYIFRYGIWRLTQSYSFYDFVIEEIAESSLFLSVISHFLYYVYGKRNIWKYH